jgi:hypothetical protein
MTRIEDALRRDRVLLAELSAINARRDGGAHTLGEIWRRHRLSCPTREQLGSYLLNVLPPDLHSYLTFHLDVVGCRRCQANVADLRERQAEAATSVEIRRRRYFQSSAGLLPNPG